MIQLLHKSAVYYIPEKDAHSVRGEDRALGDRQVTATRAPSKQEHPQAATAANRELHLAAPLQPCNSATGPYRRHLPAPMETRSTELRLDFKLGSNNIIHP